MFTRQHIAEPAARRMAQARVVAIQPIAFPILAVELARGMAASESGCVESATLVFQKRTLLASISGKPLA